MENLNQLIEDMYYEGIDSCILSNGTTLIVYGDGTFEIV
jgi:hypothetical protein